MRSSISRRLSVKGHQPGLGARRPLPVPSSGHRSTAGGRVVFPGSPGEKGIPTPPKGVRRDAAPRRRKAEEGCPGRGWVRSNEDSFVTRGVLFLSRWSGEEGPRKLLRLRGRPSPPPRLPHGPAEAAGPGRTGGRIPGLEGQPSPARTRSPSGRRELPHLAPAASLGASLTSLGLSVRQLPGKDRGAQPWGTVSLLPVSTPVRLPQLEKVRAAGPPSPRARGSPLAVASPPGWGARRFALGTRKPLSPGAPFAAGAPRRGGALPGTRGRRSPVEPGGGEGGGPAACENCYFSSITRNLCKCPGQDTSRPAGWGHGDNTAMEKSKLHLLTSSQIQITALAWRGEGSERSM